jgi:hypothetical protein
MISWRFRIFSFWIAFEFVYAGTAPTLSLGSWANPCSNEILLTFYVFMVVCITRGILIMMLFVVFESVSDETRALAKAQQLYGTAVNIHMRTTLGFFRCRYPSCAHSACSSWRAGILGLEPCPTWRCGCGPWRPNQLSDKLNNQSRVNNNGAGIVSSTGSMPSRCSINWSSARSSVWPGRALAYTLFIVHPPRYTA